MAILRYEQMRELRVIDFTMGAFFYFFFGEFILSVNMFLRVGAFEKFRIYPLKPSLYRSKI